MVFFSLIKFGVVPLVVKNFIILHSNSCRKSKNSSVTFSEKSVCRTVFQNGSDWNRFSPSTMKRYIWEILVKTSMCVHVCMLVWIFLCAESFFVGHFKTNIL